MISRKTMYKRLKILGVTYIHVYIIVLLLIYNRAPTFPVSDAVRLFFGYFFPIYLEFLYISNVNISNLIQTLLVFFIPICYVFFGTWVIFLFSIVSFFLSLSVAVMVLAKL